MCYQQVNDMCEVSPTEWWVAFSPHSWHLCDQRECYHTSHLSSWITGSNFNTSWLTSLWSQSPITPHTFHLGDHRVHLQLLMTDISVLVIMWSHATHDDRTMVVRPSCVYLTWGHCRRSCTCPTTSTSIDTTKNVRRTYGGRTADVPAAGGIGGAGGAWRCTAGCDCPLS